MPSLKSRLITWLIWFMYRGARNTTIAESLERITNRWPSQSSPEVIPKFVVNDDRLDVHKREFKGSIQTWEVITMRAKEGSRRGKIVLWWHGGAFVSRAHDVHYKAMIKLLINPIMDCSTVIFPIYHKAPISTSEQCISNGIELLLSIADNDHYSDKEIVTFGDSAGSWILLRMIEALCEIALDEKDERAERIHGLIQRMKKGVLISGCVDMVLTDEVRALKGTDVWLSPVLFQVHTPLWAFGPSYFPSHSFNLPPHISKSVTTGLTESERLPFAHPHNSPVNGIDLFARYHKQFPDEDPFQFLQTIGTHDLAWPQNRELHRRLLDLGSEVVESELVVEKGLYHVYPLLYSTQETKRAWSRIEAMMRL